VSGAGRVVAIDRASVPNTNKPARMLTVDRDRDGVRLQFYSPLDDAVPPIGTAIEWGPHHYSWAGGRADKTREYDPDAPFL
jgi:hypothetical protein